MKKMLAFALAVIILFGSVSLVASAAEEKDVVRMWLCSEISDNSGVGHIFLFFQNLTNKTVTVGKYKLGGKKDVSVGCFGTEGTKGAGVYYNLESKLDHYSKLIGKSVRLTKSELATVSKKIRSFNWWDPILNCNYFALLAWNAGPGTGIPFLIFPDITRFFIRITGGSSVPFDLYSRKVKVYKQTQL